MLQYFFYCFSLSVAYYNYDFLKKKNSVDTMLKKSDSNSASRLFHDCTAERLA